MVVVVAILTTIVFGIPVVLAVDRNARGPMLLGLGYLYGAGVIYIVELALALIGVRWNAVNVNAIAIAIAAICFFVRKPTQHSALSTFNFSWLDLATLIMIAAHTALATMARLWEWDFWAIWGLKARTFYDLGSIDWRFLESRWNDFTHPDYPLLLPLNYAYTAIIGGGWDDRWLGLVTVVFGVSLLLIVRALAGMETTPLFAAAITFASTVFALSRFIGLAEGPLIAFAGAGVLFLRRAVLFDDDAAMRHGALLLGLAAATKNEGTALLVAVAIALALSKVRLVIRLWPSFVIAAPWLIVRALHRFPTDLVRGAFLGRLIDRLGAIVPITAMLLRYLALRWMWLGILVALIVVRRDLRARERFTLMVYVIQIAFAIAIYFGTANSVEWQIATSWTRVAIQLGTPLLVVTMLILLQTYHSPHAEARSEQP